MSRSVTLVLVSGGLRSLVGLAQVLSEPQRQQVHILHLRDGRTNVRIRSQRARAQADHYQIKSFIELPLGHLQSRHDTSAPNEKATTAMLRPQILMTALAQGIELAAQRVVWPVHCNGVYDQVAKITEQVLLIEQLADLEHGQHPKVTTPLLELNDQQLIELGAQLDVPFELGWSCLLNGEQACRVCAACRGRQAAFAAAGMIDPAEKVATAKA